MSFEAAVREHLDAADPSLFDPAATMPERRAALTREIDRIFGLFGQPGPETVTTRDHRMHVEGCAVALRSYHPAGATRPLPGHVVLHGGGWTTGSIDERVADATARHRAEQARCVVVLVEYRLAPEFPFPAAVHDAAAAVRWTREHADDLGVDPHVLTLGGASAGANLAAAAVLAEPAQALAGLVLEVPALDLREEAIRTPVDYDPDYAETFARTDADLAHLCRLYVGSPERARSPLASPLLAPDVSGFPRTRILTAELDPLRAGGELFARRLSDAGVPVEVTCYRGALHGSPILTATWPTARRWHEDIVAFLRSVHGTGPEQ